MEENDKKNIWIFHHYATPPTLNGFTRPYDFGVNLLDHNIETTVFSSSYLHFTNENLIKDGRDYIIDSETEIPHIFINTYEYKGNGLDRIFNMISYYRNLFKVSKEYLKTNAKPDYILASSPHPLTMIAGIKIAKKMNIPSICEVRDFWPEVFFFSKRIKEKSLVGRILTSVEHWIYNSADSLIFLKEGDYTYLTDKKWDLEQGGDIDLDKVYYINNGVDLDEFTKTRNENTFKDKDLTNNKFNIVYTGAIRPVNNVGNILDTAKLLIDDPDIQFLIYGEGNQLKELQQRVYYEKIDNVKFKGYIDKKYIPYILNYSSVNLLNYSQSKYNWSRGNSSNKLFEYMASGKPIISTVQMGYSVIDKFSCGIELKNASPKDLSEAILRLKNIPKNKYNEMGRNAKKGAENFDFKILTKKLVEILKET